MAHYPEYSEEALKHIEDLLAEAIRSVGWDFSENIAQAEHEGNEHIDELKALAARITSPD